MVTTVLVPGPKAPQMRWTHLSIQICPPRALGRMVETPRGHRYRLSWVEVMEHPAALSHCCPALHC